MNYTLIIIGFILIVAIYMLYQYFTNSTLTSGVVKLDKVTTYTYDQLQDPTSKIYSCSGWIFLTGGAGGFIFKREAIAGTPKKINIGLYIDGTTLSLYGGGTPTPADPNSALLFTITNQIPLQKWVYIVINVNGDLVEVYVNGKIVKTVKLNSGTLTTGDHFSPTASLIVGDGNIKGYLTQFIMVTRLIDAVTVWKNYLNGNTSNGIGGQILSYFMPYNINMAVSKDDVVQRQFSIF